MRFAISPSNLRVSADEANRQDEYRCPICNQKLVLKQGKVLPPHFAHFPNKPCTDTWQYEQSLWRENWIRKFPEDAQECLVSHNGQHHYADAMVENNVILFLDTHITEKHFLEKTKFFRQNDRTVFWVIHVEEDIDAGILRRNPKDHNNMFWDHPPVFLENMDLKADKKLHILLDPGKNKLQKVEWAAPDSKFGRIIADSTFTPDLTTVDGCREAALNVYGRFDAFKQKHMPWHKKASSTNSAPDKRWHICEMTGGWHLDKCKTCKYNLISEYRSANKITGEKGGLYFYCCYPAVKQQPDPEHDDAVQMPTIWLR